MNEGALEDSSAVLVDFNKVSKNQFLSLEHFVGGKFEDDKYFWSRRVRELWLYKLKLSTLSATLSTRL